MTSQGNNSSGNLMFTFQVTNGTVTTSGGNVVLNTILTWTWLQGQNTPWPNVLDDEYQFTGNSSCTGSDGHTFTTTINSPLIISMSCQWGLEGGKVTITVIRVRRSWLLRLRHRSSVSTPNSPGSFMYAFCSSLWDFGVFLQYAHRWHNLRAYRCIACFRRLPLGLQPLHHQYTVPAPAFLSHPRIGELSESGEARK